MTDKRKATVHRMVMPKHVCPYGLKTVDLLRRRGFDVDDRWLQTRSATDAFKAEYGVATTPQTFVDGERIGGYDDVRRWLGLRVRDPEATSYLPVLVLFAIAALLAMAVSWRIFETVLTLRTAEWFVSFAMCLLALPKLQDVPAFSTMFLNYDLLARRFVPYASIYPFAELLAGTLMAADALKWVSVPVALFIGSIGAASVVKAVYFDKREIKCACVGGNSRVPLGFVSLTENLMMVTMAIWMLVRTH